MSENKFQSDAEKDAAIKDANQFLKSMAEKVNLVIKNSENLSDFKVEEVVNKMAVSEARQNLKVGKANEIDIARFLDEFEDATTVDMIFDAIGEAIKLPKKDPKKRSAKNFNSILNFIELNDEEKEILREMVKDKRDINDGSLPEHFTQFAIRNYFGYLDTTKWNLNYNYLVGKLKSLEVIRAPQGSIDLNSAVKAVIIGKADMGQINLVDSKFPYNGTKEVHGKISNKYKAYLTSSLSKFILGSNKK
jgi:hypothetical protein